MDANRVQELMGLYIRTNRTLEESKESILERRYASENDRRKDLPDESGDD